jgi:recombination protein U
MQEFEQQGGIAFLIIHFTAKDEIYYMTFRELYRYWQRMKDGGRKSFTYDEMDKSYEVHAKKDILVHYLEALQKDLEQRD